MAEELRESIKFVLSVALISIASILVVVVALVDVNSIVTPVGSEHGCFGRLHKAH